MTRSREHDWLKIQIKYAHIKKNVVAEFVAIIFFLVLSYLVKMDLCISLLYFTDICQAKNIYFVHRHIGKMIFKRLQSAADFNRN